MWSTKRVDGQLLSCRYEFHVEGFEQNSYMGAVAQINLRFVCYHAGGIFVWFRIRVDHSRYIPVNFIFFILC